MVNYNLHDDYGSSYSDLTKRSINYSRSRAGSLYEQQFGSSSSISSAASSNTGSGVSIPSSSVVRDRHTVARSVCRNCTFVFLCPYSSAGPEFCSLDCRSVRPPRSMMGLHVMILIMMMGHVLGLGLGSRVARR
jgi:hypothetical protein